MGNGSKVASNFLWRFFERFGAQLLNIVVGIILARKLGPGPSGQIAVVLAVINILKVFADSGMANALIQKKDPDDLDFSSVFFFNLGFSLLLYLGLFLAAPRIAVFYQEESYVAILRVLGLLVVISGLYNVQLAYVSKTMQFKRFFFATLGGTLFSGALSIAMVYLGFGIWSAEKNVLRRAPERPALLRLEAAGGILPRHAVSADLLPGDRQTLSQGGARPV